MDYLMLLLGIAIGIALGSVGVIAFRRGGNEGLARAEEASRQLESVSTISGWKSTRLARPRRRP